MIVRLAYNPGPLNSYKGIRKQDYSPDKLCDQTKQPSALRSATHHRSEMAPVVLSGNGAGGGYDYE